MNVFVIDESVPAAARLLARVDPVRARKQLVECCQLLATVDILTGRRQDEWMLKMNGEPYKAGHPHHPLTRFILAHESHYHLTYDLASALATCFPRHGSGTSLSRWKPLPREPEAMPHYLLCRRGDSPVLCTTVGGYASECRKYLREKKGIAC